mgnify:FL=1
MPDLQYEQKYIPQLVCGLDEVGRGSLAGPLVTAGVILPNIVNLPEVNDSKQIPKSEHERLVKEIYSQAIEVRVDITPANEVDRLGINPAIKASMTRVANSFVNKPQALLIDVSPWQKLELNITQETVVKGDTKSLSIACASLVAKYIHDRIMKELDEKYPEFGFANNTGYGTAQHKEALQRYGYTPEHRMSYKPLSLGGYNKYGEE